MFGIHQSREGSTKLAGFTYFDISPLKGGGRERGGRFGEKNHIITCVVVILLSYNTVSLCQYLK